MNDPNPYDAPDYRPQQRDRFGLGVLVGLLIAFAAMGVMFVVGAAFLFVGVSRPTESIVTEPVLVAPPGEAELPEEMEEYTSPPEE